MALPVLHDLGTGWTLGGGTALFLSLNHRVSYDIDVFLEDPRDLKQIAANPRTKDISREWQFPGNYLKLILPKGEIDFILAALMADNASFEYNFHGRTILVETPLEIIAKKIRHRGSSFTIRDVFDFASAIDNDPLLVGELAKILEKTDFERTLDRTRLLQENFSSEAGVSRFINIAKPISNRFSMFEQAIEALKDTLSQ